MAAKPDLKAQKERKQKIVLAVLGVLLVGVAALQGPKLLKHSSSAKAAPATAVTTPGDGAPTTSGGTATVPSAPVNVSASRSSAQVGGVVLAPAKTPDAVQGQLWSFSRFKAKDPFVQQVKDASSSAGSPAGSTPGAPTSSAGSPAGSTPGAPTSPTATGGIQGATGGSAVPALVAVPPSFATLLVDGRPQQLTLKQLFPKGDPIFVLVKIVGKNARIGVAGGSFTAGNTILIEIGKRVTLMNTTTGQRYVVKLVYVGDQPETIARFKGGSTAPASGASTTATAAPASAP
jgi:hypothetical protein